MSDYTRSTVSTINGINAETAKIQIAVNSKIDKSGGAFTGTVDMNEQRLINLPDATDPSEAMPLGQATSILEGAEEARDDAQQFAENAASSAGQAAVSESLAASALAQMNSFPVEGALAGALALPGSEVLVGGVEAKEIFNNVFLPEMYGAAGDGVTDDSAAVIACIHASAGSGAVHIRGKYLCNTSLSFNNLNDVTIVGLGGKIFCTTPISNGLIVFSDCNDISVKGVDIKGSNTSATQTNAFQYHGIRFSRCSRVSVSGCKVYNHSGGGILFFDCAVQEAKDNVLYGNRLLFDIACGYGTSGIRITDGTVTGNICHSNNRYGVIVQGYGDRFVISNNNIKQKREYGIMVYRFDTDQTQFIEKVTITGNIVEDVSHNPDESYFSGMGIYVQTATDVTISDNVVNDVLKGRPDQAAPNRTLSPGAISVASCSKASVTGNVIDGSGIDGIDITNANDPNLGSVVSSNVITNVYRDGIYASQTLNCNIVNNVVSGTVDKLGTGINVLSTSNGDSKNISVAGNTVNAGFASGITANNSTGTNVASVSIRGNRVVDIPGTYYTALNCNGLVFADNTAVIDSVEHTTGGYAAIINNCEQITCTGNNAYRVGAIDFKRGLAVINSTGGVVSGNFIKNTSDVTYSLSILGNTDVHVYNNRNDRQQQPMIGPHTIGTDTASQTSIRVIYKTSIPLASDGSFAAGSIALNIAPVAGGNAGWICVAAGTPGTWKAYGTIEA